MKHSIGAAAGSSNLFSHKNQASAYNAHDTDSSTVEAVENQGMTMQMLADKQSKDAATSHLRKQAF